MKAPNRVWKNASGQIVKTQSLTLDAFGRLMKLSERDTNSCGFNLTTVFDGLGRQTQTIETAVTNSVAMVTNPAPVVVSFTYDPQVEFLVIGINVSQGTAGRQDWLTYGPDVSGRYGGMHGVGGLETITTVSTSGNITATILNDCFGNVLGAVTNNTVAWNSSRLNLYAPVEGYAPPRLSLNAPVYASLAYRTRPINAAGLVQLGARTYDPQRRAFLSADPLGHSSDWALNTAFNGNPAFYFDPSGRLAASAVKFAGGAVIGFSEGTFGIKVGAPSSSEEYNGRVFGRSTSEAVSIYLSLSGAANTGTGLGVMATSGALEGATIGGATLIAGPAFIAGAELAIGGLVQTAVGSFGLYNFSQLTPLGQPSNNSGQGSGSGQNPPNAPNNSPSVPQNAVDTLNQIESTGTAPQGFKGGGSFLNDGRSGGQVLPTADVQGNPVTYREWDVNPHVPGVNRGTQRIVTGSDGSVYYTGDHYTTFTKVK